MIGIGLICTAIAVLAFAAPGLAQVASSSPPNFTGKWRLTGNSGSDHVLEISHSGNEIDITESWEHQKKPYSNRIRLYTDRRGERNLRRIPNIPTLSEVKSQTFWKKDKLVRKSTYSIELRGARDEGAVTVSETDEFGLSKDGETLTVKSVSARNDGMIRAAGPPPSPQMRSLPSSPPMRPRPSAVNASRPIEVYQSKRVFKRVS